MGSIYVWARSGMLTIMDKAMASLPFMPSSGEAEISLLAAQCECVSPEALILLLVVSMGSIYVWARSEMTTIMDKAMASLPVMPSSGEAEIGLLAAQRLGLRTDEAALW